jgi:hypothetical protein
LQPLQERECGRLFNRSRVLHLKQGVSAGGATS